MARGLKRLVALGAAAVSVHGFHIAPRVSNGRVCMKASAGLQTQALNVVKKAGILLPTVLLPFALSPSSRAVAPSADTAISQVFERGAANPVAAGWADAIRGPSVPQSTATSVNSGKEDFQAGLKELRSALRNPNEFKEALELLKDPKYRQEVQRMQNDPSFQREFKALSNSPEFQQAVRQARSQLNQITQDPQAQQQLRNQVSQ